MGSKREREREAERGGQKARASPRLDVDVGVGYCFVATKRTTQTYHCVGSASRCDAMCCKAIEPKKDWALSLCNAGQVGAGAKRGRGRA